MGPLSDAERLWNATSRRNGSVRACTGWRGRAARNQEGDEGEQSQPPQAALSKDRRHDLGNSTYRCRLSGILSPIRTLIASTVNVSPYAGLRTFSATPCDTCGIAGVEDLPVENDVGRGEESRNAASSVSLGRQSPPIFFALMFMDLRSSTFRGAFLFCRTSSERPRNRLWRRRAGNRPSDG
jgi:hypothetical protein